MVFRETVGVDGMSLGSMRLRFRLAVKLAVKSDPKRSFGSRFEYGPHARRLRVQWMVRDVSVKGDAVGGVRSLQEIRAQIHKDPSAREHREELDRGERGGTDIIRADDDDKWHWRDTRWSPSGRI